MSLSSYKVTASIAVSDMAHVRAFHEEKLGLLGAGDQADDRRIDVCGAGIMLHVYLFPDHAGNTFAIEQ